MNLNAIYYAQGYGCPVNPIAIRPRFAENHVSWSDTSDRIANFTLRKIWGVEVPNSTNTETEWQKCPQTLNISVETDQGVKMIALTLLTLKVYNEKIRHQVAGKLQFNTDEEVQSYYLKTGFGSYYGSKESR